MSEVVHLNVSRKWIAQRFPSEEKTNTDESSEESMTFADRLILLLGGFVSIVISGVVIYYVSVTYVIPVVLDVATQLEQMMQDRAKSS